MSRVSIAHRGSYRPLARSAAAATSTIAASGVRDSFATTARQLIRLLGLLALLSGGGCEGTVEPPKPPQASGSSSTTVTRPALSYAPRVTLDTSGFQFVGQMIPPWKPDATLDEIATAWREFSYQPSAPIDVQLSQTDKRIGERLRPLLTDVNVVSAPIVAKERGIVIDEVTRAAEGDYESLITLSVTTETQERAVAGTVFQDGKPRRRKQVVLSRLVDDANLVMALGDGIRHHLVDLAQLEGHFVTLVSDTDGELTTRSCGHGSQSR